MARHAQITQNNMFPISLQYLKKEVGNELDFLHVDKHGSFPQANFNSMGIKVSYKVILSLLMSMIKHSQRTQCNIFKICQKEFRGGVYFLLADKHQSFYKLKLLLMMEVARCV